MILLGKNRDRVSIVAAILEASASGSTKTYIMKMSNLSFKLLKKYLAVVLNGGFVKQVGSKYILTDQGRAFLKRYESFHIKYYKAETILSQLMIEWKILDQKCGQVDLTQSCEQRVIG